MAFGVGCREQENRPDLSDRDFGIRKVEENINCRETEDPGDPNPEPPQLQHLREYSNYMSPRKGLLSADTWTLIAIYVRNLLLNLTIFIPLIAAVLMIPRFLFQAAVQKSTLGVTAMWTLIAAIALGSFSIAFVISRLPSKTKYSDIPNPRTRWERFLAFLNTDSGVLIFGVMPLLISAYLASVLWARGMAFGSDLSKYYLFSIEFGLPITENPTYFLLTGAVAYLIGLLIFLGIKFRKADRDISAGIWALVSSLVGGLLLWVVAYKLLPLFFPGVIQMLGPERAERYIWQLFMIGSVPIFLGVVLIAATIFVGFTSRTATDEDREWLARYGAWVLIVSGAWIVLNSMTILGPSFLQWTLNFHSRAKSFRLRFPRLFRRSSRQSRPSYRYSADSPGRDLYATSRTKAARLVSSPTHRRSRP